MTLKKAHKKPVTLDDYRNDRDYWKRRAGKQQHVIDTIERHKDRLENERAAEKSAADYFREQLQEICPHDKLNPAQTIYDGSVKCDRCKLFVKPTT